MYRGKEIKKQKILEAAYQLFSENGYKKTKIVDIAAAAGIGKGTVYEYFDSKETLLISIFSSGVEEHLDSFKKVTECEMTQTEKLIELVNLETTCTREHGARMMKMSQMILDNSDGLSADFIKRMNEVWNRKYKFVHQILAKGIETGEFRNMNADMATVAIMGAVGSYLNLKYGVSILPDVVLPFDAKSFNIEELIGFLLEGIRI